MSHLALVKCLKRDFNASPLATPDNNALSAPEFTLMDHA